MYHQSQISNLNIHLLSCIYTHTKINIIAKYRYVLLDAAKITCLIQPKTLQKFCFIFQ